MEAQVEPDTYGLLLADVPKEVCRHLFPRRPPTDYKQQFEQLAAAQAELLEASSPPQRLAAVEQVQRSLQALPGPTELRGLRIDVAIHDPTTGMDYWVDTSTVHTSSVSHLPVELKAWRTRRQAANVAAEQNCVDTLEMEPSPSVVKREQQKKTKYAILMSLAQRQIIEHKRQTLPALSPFVLTDNGEIGPAANTLQEQIVEAFRRRPRSQMDGITTAQRVMAFRQKFRNEIVMALAAGLGAMACNAGVPWGPLTDLIAPSNASSNR